jgi:hypothetical protein
MNGLQVYHDIGPGDDVDVSFRRHSQPLFRQSFWPPLTRCLKNPELEAFEAWSGPGGGAGQGRAIQQRGIDQAQSLGTGQHFQRWGRRTCHSLKAYNQGICSGLVHDSLGEQTNVEFQRATVPSPANASLTTRSGR